LSLNTAAASFTPDVDVSVLGDGYMVSDSSKFNNGQLHGRIKLLNQDEETKTYVELGAGGLVGDQAESYVILPQAYYHHAFNDVVSFDVGRVVKSYSVLDDYWMLGDVSPLFRWDAARPEIQGLPGVFVEVKPSKNIQFEVFGSYLYLPSQGPSYSLVNGKLTSGNPWFAPPVDNVEFGNVNYDLHFNVNTPPVSDIIFTPSGGAVLTLKTDDENLWVRGGYFLKPRNEIALPFDVAFNIVPHTGDVTVHPRTLNHRLAVADVGGKIGAVSLSASGIWENVEDLDVESPTWIYPDYSDEYKVGLNLAWQVNAFHTIEMGYLQTVGSSVSVKGIPNGVTIDVYSFRDQYDDAVDLRWTGVFSPRKNGFLYKAKARYAYDYKVETSLVQLDFIYKPFMSFSFFTRADLFGGNKKPQTDIYNNLMANYLDKDRVQVGVQYAF